MNDTRDEGALKPCPFCGGEAEHSVGETGDGNPWHYVECLNCGATGPNPPYADHNIDVVACRALDWNTRAPDPRIAALEEQVAQARDRALEDAQRAVSAACDEDNSVDEATARHAILALRSRPSPAPSEAVRERVARAIMDHRLGAGTYDNPRNAWQGAEAEKEEIRREADSVMRALASEGERDG